MTHFLFHFLNIYLEKKNGKLTYAHRHSHTCSTNTPTYTINVQQNIYIYMQCTHNIHNTTYINTYTTYNTHAHMRHIQNVHIYMLSHT